MPGLASGILEGDKPSICSSRITSTSSYGTQLDASSVRRKATPSNSSDQPQCQPETHVAPRSSSLPHPSSFSSSTAPFTSAIVTILVGGGRPPSLETSSVPFHAHSDLLTSLSPFFRAALAVNQGYGFLESQTRVIRLPEERLEDVTFFLQWCYRRGLQPPSSMRKLKPGKTCPVTRSSGLSGGALWHPKIDIALGRILKCNPDKEPSKSTGRSRGVSPPLIQRSAPPAFGPLVRLYILADKFGIVELKDNICERVREASLQGNCVPCADDVWTLWEGTSPRAKLRELVLDLYVGMKCRKLLAGITGEGSGRGSGLTAEMGSETEEEWHEGFLRAVCCRAIEEAEESVRKDARVQRPETGDETEGDEWVMVGRLRRHRCQYHEHE